jgi:hypothetical protein|tara:strand:- start:126 stop:341 length:216 start_codon:yes stop_codon:yes gene_type:complete
MTPYFFLTHSINSSIWLSDATLILTPRRISIEFLNLIASGNEEMYLLSQSPLILIKFRTSEQYKSCGVKKA